jgi:hypothetical protein
MKTAEQTKRIVAVAVTIARETGLHTVTCTAVAKRLQMTHVNVLHHVGTADRLRDMTARRAIADRDKTILASLMVANHPIAKEIPGDLRREIIAALV